MKTAAFVNAQDQTDWRVTPGGYVEIEQEDGDRNVDTIRFNQQSAEVFRRWLTDLLLTDGAWENAVEEAAGVKKESSQ